MPAMAQSKVASINVQRILAEAPQAKRAQGRLEAEIKKREAELKDMEGRLRAASEKFEKEAVTLSETQRRDRQNQLGDMDRELQRRQRDLRDELGQRQQSEVADVMAAANRAIKAIAERESLDIVVQEWAYANPKIDITDKVLKAMSDAK